MISDVDTVINNFTKLADSMETFGFSGSLLIAKGKEIIHNKGYGFSNYQSNIRNTNNTIFSVGSIAKQFTATVIMRYVDLGMLNVEDSVSKYIQKIPEDKREITLHNLLTHTSGLQDVIDDFVYMETEEFVLTVFNKELQFEPGSQFSYSNTGYSILGIILEYITGKSYQTVMREEFEKLNIFATWFSDPILNDENSAHYYVEGKHTGSLQSWKGSYEKPYWGILGNGGICITTKDLYIWISKVLEGGYLSDLSKKKLLTPFLNNYAYGWDVEDSPFGTLIKHDGGSSLGVNAICRYYVDKNITVIILSNVVLNGYGMAFQLENAIENIIEGMDYIKPLKPTKSFEIKEMKGDGYQIENLEYGPSILKISSQDIINQFLDISHEQKIEFDRMNDIMSIVGNHLVNEEWTDAFSYMKNKNVSEKRIEMITELIASVVKEYGKIITVKSGGTIPFPGYYSATTLLIETKRGRKGVPFIWDDKDTILGFRPMFSDYPLSMLLTKTDHNIYQAVNIQLNIDIKFTLDENKIKIIK